MIEEEYLLFTIEHKCNSKCNICFLEGEGKSLIDLHTLNMPYFKKFLEFASNSKVTGVIFSGGEVTLNDQLEEYASYARDKGFQNIMIQTNARALSNLNRVKQLKSAGINQFFVSFHACDYDLSDRITGRVGAHAQTVKGLENLEKLSLTVLTNTVMTSMNYTTLPDIGQFLKKFNNIVEMQFWGYVPVSLQASELVLPYGLAAPYLNRTIEFLLGQGREICVKSFPVCLLDDQLKKCHNNSHARCFGVDKNFNKRIVSCDYKTFSCCRGTDCDGLPRLYYSTALSENWMPSTKSESTVYN